MTMTPDELFTKYTVVEVKAFQTRLKSSHAYLQGPLVLTQDNLGPMQRQSRRNFDSWLGK
jgi:hypothetical protein